MKRNVDTCEVDMKITGDVEFDELLRQVTEILKTKGADYTLGTGDRLHNFRTVAEFCGMTMQEVWGVYFYKHMSAIFSFIKNGGKVESEPIDGRILDAVTYLLLFYKIVKETEKCAIKNEKKSKKKKQASSKKKCSSKDDILQDAAEEDVKRVLKETFGV